MANPSTVDAKQSATTTKPSKLTDKEASAEIVRAWTTLQGMRVGKAQIKLASATRDSWWKNASNFETWVAYHRDLVAKGAEAYQSLRRIASSNPGASVLIKDTKGGYSRTVNATVLVMALDRDESQILKCDFVS